MSEKLIDIAMGVIWLASLVLLFAVLGAGCYLFWLLIKALHKYLAA